MAKSTRWTPWAGWDLELVPSQALPAAHTTPGDCSLNEREGARAPGVGRPAKGGSGQTGRGRGRQAHRQPRRRREHLAAGVGGSIFHLLIGHLALRLHPRAQGGSSNTAHGLLMEHRKCHPILSSKSSLSVTQTAESGLVTLFLESIQS